MHQPLAFFARMIARALIALTLALCGASSFAQTTPVPPIPKPRPAQIFASNPPAAPLDLEGQGEAATQEGSQGEANAAQAASQAANQEIAQPQANIEPAPAAQTQQATPTPQDQPVTLIARISEAGAIIPQGLIWRIYDTTATADGQLDLIAKSEAATALFSLPPGEYLVHAGYGNAQVSDTLIVEQGPNEKTFILDAGALKLRSAISGDLPIGTQRLNYEISTLNPNGERVTILSDVKPDQLIHLNAGIYSVTSNWGRINASVRADLRVEPGQITEAVLFHKASQINLKLVSAPRGEAIADVDWSIRDSEGNEIFTFFGAFPTLILTEGDYSVIAKLGSNVFNRDFQVIPGEPRELEVLTTVTNPS